MGDDIKEYKPNKSNNTTVDSSSEKDNTVIFNKSEVQKANTNKDNHITLSELNRLKEKSKKNKSIFRAIWIVMVVLISVMLTKYILVGINDMLAITRSSSEKSTVTVTIPPNPNTGKVADQLIANKLINDKSFFELYSIFTKSSTKFTQGTFEMETGMDYEAIINYLQTQSNRTDIINLTFPEGKTILECAKILSDNGICNYDEFLKACNSDQFDENYDCVANISNAGDRYYKLEGYLFPDTYTFYHGEDPKYTINRFLNNYEKKIYSKKKVSGFDDKVSIEDIANSQGMSVENLLTLASMIQAEAADEEDMYYVSSVFKNRLSTLQTNNKNKFDEYGLDKLGSDVTVWYPYKSKSDIPSDLLSQFPSKYDTYTISGLPAGPVCNPGMDAIDAALNPKSTDYFYFCHSNDGKAYYAKTSSEHEINLKKAGLK